MGNSSSSTKEHSIQSKTEVSKGMKLKLMKNIQRAEAEGMPNKLPTFTLKRYLKDINKFKLFQGNTSTGESITVSYIILDDISFEEECNFRKQVTFIKNSISELKKDEIYSEWAETFVSREREYYEILTIRKRCYYFYVKNFNTQFDHSLNLKIDDLTESKILGILHRLIAMADQLHENQISFKETTSLESIYIHNGNLVLGEITQFKEIEENRYDDNRGRTILNMIEKIIGKGRGSQLEFPKLIKLLCAFDSKRLTLQELKDYLKMGLYDGIVNLNTLCSNTEFDLNLENSYDLTNLWEILKVTFSIGLYDAFDLKAAEIETFIAADGHSSSKHWTLEFFTICGNYYRALGYFSKCMYYFNYIEEFMKRTTNFQGDIVFKIGFHLNKAALYYDLEDFVSMEVCLNDGFTIIESLNENDQIKIDGKIILYGVGFCFLNEIKGYRQENRNNFLRIKEILDKNYTSEPLLKSLIFKVVGDSFRRLGESETAKENYLKSLELLETLGFENHPYKTICKRNLGSLLVEIGEIQNAFSYLETALDQYEEFYGSKSIEYNDCLNALAYAYLKVNKRKALDLFKIALEIYLRYLGRLNKKSIECMNNIGSILLENEKNEQAFAYFSLALNFAQESLKIKNSNRKKFQEENQGRSLHSSLVELNNSRYQHNDYTESKFNFGSQITKKFDLESSAYFEKNQPKNLRDNTLVITLLNNLYLTSNNLGMTSDSGKSLQEAYTLCKHLKNTNNIDLVVNALYSNTLISISDNDIADKNFNLSFQRIQESIKTFETIIPGNPCKIKAITSYLQNLATINSVEEAYMEGERYRSNLIEKDFTNKLDVIHLDLALASICSQSSIHSQKGLNLIEECEKLVDTHLSDDDPLRVQMMNIKGACQLSLQFYKEAQTTLKTTIELATKSKLNQEESIARSNLGILYLKTNHIYKAESQFKKAISLKNEIQEDLSLSNSYNNLGNLYRLKESYEKAILNYGHALKIRRDILPLSNGKIWSLVQNISTCIGKSISEFNYLKMIEDIISENKQILELDVHSINHFAKANINAANILCRLGKYEKAKEMIQTSIKEIQYKDKIHSPEFNALKQYLFSIS